MSIERFLLVNLLMDAALVTIVGRSCGTFSAARSATAAGLGTVYAVLASARPAPWSEPPFQLAMLAGMSALAAGRAGFRR